MFVCIGTTQLDGNMITKVADFGLSHVKQENNKAYGVGQIPWMAGEGML